MKRFILLTAVVAFMAGCNNTTNADNTIERNAPDIVNDVVQEVPTLEEQENYAEFVVDIENGTVSVCAFYNKAETLGNVFLLNRDFTVHKLICDGDETDPDTVMALINFDEEYLVNEYRLPKFENTLYIEYTGYLSGESSSTQYAKETISKDFTIFRSETYCYPIFAQDWYSLIEFIFEPVQSRITVDVPSGYIAAMPYPQISVDSFNDRERFIFNGDMAGFNCAIARFNILRLPSGNYYLLPEMDLVEMTDFITPIMEQAQTFLNEHFGEAEISTDMNYIVIPDTFGSYVSPSGKGVFIQESSFTSIEGMRQLIHEFIHLGWNAEAEFGEVQRARFFDEAFTCYFEYRVYGYMTDDEAYQNLLTRTCDYFVSTISGDESYLVPVVDYGKYEFGDFSYYFGPVFFDAFANLVGVEAFDAATKEFLQKYKNVPVNFDMMCEEYTSILDAPELEEFFQDWLYSTNAIERLITNSAIQN